MTEWLFCVLTKCFYAFSTHFLKGNVLLYSTHSDSKFNVLNIGVGAVAVIIAVLIRIITTILIFFCMSVTASSIIINTCQVSIVSTE